MFTDGFDSPVGDEAERRGDKLPPGKWLDANPYGTFYNVTPTRQAFHTGADLNLPEDRDARAPVYAVANGTVTYARKGGGTWGNLIVIRHDMPDGSAVYSRSAHVETMLVQEGQAVRRGEQIATIGNAFGQFPFHLHFDVSLSDTLRKNPEAWPGTDEAQLKRDYVNPLAFIRSNRPSMQQPPVVTPQDMIRAIQDALAQINSTLQQLSATLTPAPATPPGDGQLATVQSDIGLNVRSAPSVKAPIAGKLANGETVTVSGEVEGDGLTWCKVMSGAYAGGYVAKAYLSFAVTVDDPAAVG